MQDPARHTQRPVVIDRSIRVRLSSERAEVAAHLARLLGKERHIELLPATDAGADVLVLDCATFPPASAASLQQTARRHEPARVLWILDSAPDGAHATRRMLEAVRNGWCDGFVVKDCPAHILLRAIAAVAGHEIFLPRSMLMQALVNSGGWRSAPVTRVPAPRAGRPRVLLTIRERQVVQQVLRGLTSKEAGRNLGIKEYTVKKHLRNVYAKLGVHTRSQLLLKTSGRNRSID
jgi:DNA-binding NarL/FixJ family response regulator